MSEDHPVMRMNLQDVLAFVAELEEKYAAWPPLAPPLRATYEVLTLADLARIRASLRRSVAHLDRLLVEWDQGQG